MLLENRDSKPKERESKQGSIEKKEIWAWWGYYGGYEPMSLVACQVLIPLLLTEYSMQLSTNISTGLQCRAGESCKLFTLGRLVITPLAFSYFVNFASLFFQAMIFLQLGSLADYSNLRKRFLQVCTVVGSCLTMLYGLAFKSSLLWLVALLSISVNAVFGACLVFYNAYLPILIKNHPSAIEGKKEKVASAISTKGLISGYLCAFIILMITSIAIYFIHWRGMPALMISFTGLWWLVIGSISLRYFKEYPGEPLPSGDSYLTISIKTLSSTIQSASSDKIRKFLLAYYFVAGGYGTIGYAAITFAKMQIGISQLVSLLAVVVLLISSVIGSLAFMYLYRLMKCQAVHMVILIACLQSLIPLYGISGIVTKKFGFYHQWEVFLIATYFGFGIGAIQSFARVAFSQHIPVGKESESFALYSITDKLGSSTGILLMALINLFAENSRWCFVPIFFMLTAPIPLLINLTN